MASWMLANTPFSIPHISRLFSRPTVLSRHARLLPHVASKTFTNALSVSAEINPSDMTPSMEEMLKQPARTSGWDRSLFEDVTDEYGQAEEAGSSTQQPNPCHVLLRLVEAGDFASATRVKKELEALGVSIQPDSRYMAAAVYALEDLTLHPNTSESQLISAFDSWATFVPVPQPLLDTTFFHNISHAILPRRRLVTLRHAVVAAYMGYSSKIALRIVSWAFKSRPTIEGGTKFMQAFSDADLAYRQNAHNREIASKENRKHFKSWYALAIRTLCLHGARQPAVALAQYTRAHGYEIPLFTLRLLLRTLRDHHDPERIAWVAEEYHALEEKQDAKPTYLRPAARRMLAHQIHKVLDDGHLPTYQRLYSFINLCLASGDTELFHQVLERFHAHPRYERAIQQWVNAEMSYHFDNKNELAALFIFRQYFRPAGIPKAVQLTLEKLSYHTVPEYLASRPIPRPSALWPDARITRHLWNLLLKATQQQQLKYMFLEFDSLYNAYALLKSAPPSASPDALKQAGRLVQKGRIPPPNSAPPFNLNHYRAFLHVISRYNETALLARVIQKMRVLGWHPRKGDMDAITGCFARGGSPERLLPLLDELRGDYKATPKPRGRSARPVAVAVYRQAIQSMMVVSRHAGAAKIARHLRRRVRYHVGTNKKTDKTLRILYTEVTRGRRKRTLRAVSSTPMKAPSS